MSEMFTITSIYVIFQLKTTEEKNIDNFTCMISILLMRPRDPDYLAIMRPIPPVPN